MLEIKKAKTEDFEDVYGLLRRFNRPDISKEDWESIFTDPWNSGEGYCGYLMRDRGETVGFLGLIFCKRLIGGKEIKFCNMTSWIVKEDHRKDSLLLMYPVVRLEDHVVTNFTATKNVGKILRKLGFSELDTQYRIIFPVPSLAGFRKDIKLIYDNDGIAKHLSGQALKIFDDHKELKCVNFLIVNGEKQCHVIAKKIRRKGLPFLNVLYLSDPAMFAETIREAVFSISLKLKVLGIMADQRLTEGSKIPFSMMRPLYEPRYYKAENIDPKSVDGIYSEIILLDL